MYSADDFLKVIKKATTDAVNASKPANVVFGKVMSTSPLKIKIDQKLILSSAQLVLTRNVTNYRLSVTMNHTTNAKSGGSGDSSFESHSHDVTGNKTMTVNNALSVGEEVIMMQVSGGQKYVVIDRIGKG